MGATLCCGVQASHCGGFSCCGAQALGMQASVVVARGLSCSAACGIFPDQGLNLCPLHWQADSQPLRHHGSPPFNFYAIIECLKDLFCKFVMYNMINIINTAVCYI